LPHHLAQHGRVEHLVHTLTADLGPRLDQGVIVAKRKFDFKERQLSGAALIIATAYILWYFLCVSKAKNSR
jgi:uncharacterized membrane protein (DUF106 family)